ncbi:AzlC family ABC transporter permease [Peptoniphilus lacrimalis]|uniref:Putative azaleucine resistance protein AzlC n=1 Tax=Peptoniphilus lacrimalis 315-B TaxID=596330 RepID=D1VRT2_9FIRM|nr:AzlC family ABC transporter permease [Peptoniphilus lacrimalis]EFA90742.1 putative azaleucine resistance protein AzlC [Peptoniphilus lacrimalis 315-B]
MKEFKFALKNTLAMIFSYIFIGFACGILFYEKGISFIYAALAGIIIYAGSMQILLVPLISSSTPILIIFFTTLFVNSRHIFYGLPFVERYKKIKGLRFILMVFTMTDEVFSIITSVDYDENLDHNMVDFYILITLYITWIFSCMTGALVGNILPVNLTGIDFASVALFLVSVIGFFEDKKNRIPILIGLLTSLALLAILGKDLFLLPSIIISSLILTFIKRRPIND